MPNSSHQNINEELRVLQRKYIDKLPERTETIAQVWKTYFAQSSEDILHDIYRQVHSIAV